jgi:rod shape-determining protein MreC
MIGMFDRTRRLRLLLIVLTVVSLTIVTLDVRSHGNGPLERVGHVALTVIGPVQRGLRTIFSPLGNFFAGFTKVPSLRAEVGALQRENAQLRAQQEQIADIVRENDSLRAQLGLQRRFGNLKTLTAQVIGVGPSNFQRIVFVDRGSRQGVRKNDPVISGEGLTGRVLAVGRSTATVLLVVDRSSSVAARLGTTGETGLVTGLGSNTLDLELFDPKASVAVGDKVLTSGYDKGVFPAGVPIGTVTAAPPAGDNLSRHVRVQPFVDFSRLDYVLIVQRGAR